MTRDDIIRMAREAGLPETETEGVFRVNADDLGRLLAAEREALAKHFEHLSGTWFAEEVAEEIARQNNSHGRLRMSCDPANKKETP